MVERLTPEDIRQHLMYLKSLVGQHKFQLLTKELDNRPNNDSYLDREAWKFYTELPDEIQQRITSIRTALQVLANADAPIVIGTKRSDPYEIRLAIFSFRTLIRKGFSEDALNDLISRERDPTIKCYLIDELDKFKQKRRPYDREDS